MTHPLIAASGIGTGLSRHSLSSQDVTRPFPLSWKFISFDADGSESLPLIQADSVISGDVSDSVLPPDDKGPPADFIQEPSSQSLDLQSLDINLARDSITEPFDSTDRRQPDQNRIQPERSDLERSPTLDSPSASYDLGIPNDLDIPSDIQLDVINTLSGQTQQVEGRSPDQKNQLTFPPTDKRLTSSPSQNRSITIQTETSSLLSPLFSLNQQAEATPELPSILPSSDPTQNLLQRQSSEMKFLAGPLFDGTNPALDVTLPASLAPPFGFQATPFSTDSQSIPSFAAVQDTSNIQRRDIPSKESTIEPIPSTVPIVPSFLKSAEKYSTQPSGLEISPLQAPEIPSVKAFSVEPLPIQAEFSPVTDITETIQMQLPLAPYLDAAELAPLPTTPSDFQITEPALSSDILTLQPFITPVEAVQAVQAASQFTDSDQAQSFDTESSHDLSHQPLIQPTINAEVSLRLEPFDQSPESPAVQRQRLDVPAREGSLLDVPRYPANDVELPDSQKSLEPPIQPTLPFLQPSPEISSTLRVLDTEAPEAGRSPTNSSPQRFIRGKFTPLTPPLRHPLGAWNTVQDMIQRAIATSQEVPDSRPFDLQRRTINSSESGSPPVLVPPESEVPETWSSIEDLITSTTTPVQREAWEDQFPVLSPIPTQRQQDSNADESLPSFQPGRDTAEMVTAQLNPAALAPPTLPGDDVIQTLTLPITLKNSFSQEDLANAKKKATQTLDDETLEQLAQSLYKHVRDRLILSQERHEPVIHYPSSWLNVISQLSLTEKQNAKMSGQSTSHKSEYPTSIEVDELIYSAYLSFSQRLNNDRERHSSR